MSGQDEGRLNIWVSRAIRATGDACAWHATSPALAEIRRSDAEWLMERFGETLRNQRDAFPVAEVTKR